MELDAPTITLSVTVHGCWVGMSLPFACCLVVRLGWCLCFAAIIAVVASFLLEGSRIICVCFLLSLEINWQLYPSKRVFSFSGRLAKKYVGTKNGIYRQLAQKSQVCRFWACYYGHDWTVR